MLFDNRGHGRSEAPSRIDEYSISIFADDVYDLTNKLKIKRFCVVGHSWGGFTALQFTLDHPDMVSSLVLVGTSSEPYPKDHSYPQIRSRLDEIARTSGMQAAFEYGVATLSGREQSLQKNPELMGIERDNMLGTSVDGYIFVAKAAGEWQPVTSRLLEIKAPTLIICGDEDLPIIEAAKILKGGIPCSEVAMIKGAGHSPHLEAPGMFNNALLNFLLAVK
ncbi:alpha/beta fold hydrolase [Chloroflexota bacterium]